MTKTPFAPQLSKSKLLRLNQCPKSLWMHTHQPELRSVSPQQQMVFDTGNEVGALAQQLFPHGINIQEKCGRDLYAAQETTRQLIDQGAEIIYEATFKAENVLVMVDILVKNGHAYDVYEVKSSTKPKPVNEQDAAIQFWVLQQCGIPINKVYITTLNAQYLRRGDIHVHELFLHHDISAMVLELQSFVPLWVLKGHAILKSDSCPDLPIGPQCNQPYECDFKAHCWAAHEKRDSVLKLHRGGSVMWSLFNSGFTRLQDIPPGIELGERQRLQVEAAKHQKLHADRTALRAFLASLRAPLHHLDFETINPAIPFFDHSKPYQQIPFQFSIHRESETGNLEHFEYLHPADGSDPRETLARHMLEVLGEKGSVLVYHQSFEENRIRELAAHLPHLEARLLSIIDRMLDLEIPFREGALYHPDMEGRSSIKYVLPALVPELSYEQLPINNGGEASAAYLQRLKGKLEQDAIPDRFLLDYCKMDTLAMVKVLEKIKEVAEG